MLDKPNAIHSLGLFQNAKGLLAVLITSKKEGVVIDKTYAIDIDNTADYVKPLYTIEEGKRLLGEFDKYLPVTGVGAGETLIRPLFTQLSKDKDIDSVIEFQTEPLLPYPVENAVLDWMKISQNSEGSNLIVSSVKREHLKKHLESCQKLGIEPEVVSTTSLALAAFSGEYTQVELPFFVVDVQENEATCVLMVNRRLTGAMSCHLGLSSLREAFHKDRPEGSFKELDFTAVDVKNYPELSKALEMFCLQILKVLYGLSKQGHVEEVEKILLTGEVEGFKSLSAAIASKLGKQELFLETAKNVAVLDESLKRFAIPLGLALTVLPKTKDQVNFRQKDFSYPNPWKRLKKPLLTYFAACILVAWALNYFGQAYLGHKEDKLKESFGDLLAFMQKPYKTFEAEYEVKHPFREKLPEGEIASIEILTPEDLVERLEFLEAEIKASPDSIALNPNLPRVSDLFAWLTRHPNVVLRDEESGLAKPLIRIENLHYNMVKRPEEKKKRNRYQVKVDLEFTSPTPKLAREFHDALIEPNDYVDPKEEVKWSSSKGKYRTSFFLKDRTEYPSSS